ncbi:MAG TPA: heme-binding domain-containing protein [Candidatus Polarisedimenticolaceae bacterium]|nr:heme-binding domain-containing protein [Candidatus Polarisedimenticolaceae bacterium]
MRKILYWVGGVAVAAFVAIQFVPVDRANPPVEADLVAPDDVRQVLRVACYDCHSFETRWPWYSHIAPVSWLVARDVRSARAELVFSEWERMSAREQAELREEIWEEVEEGEMPLKAYRLMHAEARLGPDQLETLRRWAHQSQPN